MRQYDSETHHQFFIDTTASPPRSIWSHPYDDEQYLSTLSPAEREKVTRLHRSVSLADIEAESSDDDTHRPQQQQQHAELPPRKSPNDANDANPTGIHKFGRRMKDKLTHSTHAERERARQQRAEQERRAYEAHLRARDAMARALRTGEPQFLGKDTDGRDVYIEPPNGPAAAALPRGAYGYSPYAQGGAYANPNARFVRPAQPYERPYGLVTHHIFNLCGRVAGFRTSGQIMNGDCKPSAAATVAGGVHDVYGEDRASEEQVITPWSRTVASGYVLLRDPRYNKGLAFTDDERDYHYVRGLLPPAHMSQELQVKRLMHLIRQYNTPLQKYMALMDLEERNERLFYKLMIDHVEELLPIVYTPTVGEACQKYGTIFRRPQGLYISLKEKGKVHDVLRNWPEKNIKVIVVTDGERILGLGDLGCQGMGIPVGKLALYTALGGIRPSECLPITIDVGTNNEMLLNDEFYIGMKQKRATGQEYDDLLDEFMAAAKQAFGEKVLIQFEDFANHNAFKLLEKYRSTHLVFNDDIQGTASVVLAGLVASLKLTGRTLADHTFLFLGAGEVRQIRCRFF